MNQKGFANIVLVLVIVILASAAGYFVFRQKDSTATQVFSPQNNAVSIPLEQQQLALALDKKAHDLLCAENNLGIANHEQSALGYGYEEYQKIYEQTKKDFFDLQTQYKLKTGIDYPRPQLKTPPTDCPATSSTGLTPNPHAPIFPSAPSPFQLNDQSAKYYLEKLANRFALTYEKPGGRPESIYVSSDTKISLENYLGKNLIVHGEFIAETTSSVECFKAPCGPMSFTVVRLKSIAIK